MLRSAVSMPKFSQNQFVRFIGGEGKVRHFQPASGGWFYTVEMEMGPEPEMGRVGYETMIVLPETDLAAQDGEFCPV
jgi:hypothetical protein